MNNSEIISKWIVRYKEFELAITEDERVYCMKTGIQLIRCYNNGISWRYPKTTTRIGQPTLKKKAVKAKKIIRQYCPF